MQLHHVAYVVHDIDAYADSLPGLTPLCNVFDPLQHARLGLYAVGGASRIELIEPQGEAASTWRWRERFGEGLHHVCYEGVSLQALPEVLHNRRLLKIQGPLPAILFDRDVVFAMTRKRAIVEFLLSE